MTLESRITRLERSARRWRLAALALAATLSTGLLMGQVIRIGGGDGGITAPAVKCDRVTCKKLVLTAADNTERATLELDAADAAVFTLCNKKADPTLRLRADADAGGSIAILSAKGKTLATLSTDAKDQPTLSLHDAEGKKLFSAP